MIPMWLRHAIYELRLRRRFPRCEIHSGAKVDNKSTVGYSSVLFRNSSLVDSSLGNFSYIQENTSLYRADVGPFCSIAGNASIGLVDHPIFMLSTSPVFYDCTQPLPRFFVAENLFPQEQPRTAIGADVWIGEGVRIKAGVRIGVGAVIGTGSVVTHDIYPYTIVAGVPGRPMKKRFSDELCLRLLGSRWWELDDATLTALAPYCVDPVRFLSALDEIKSHWHE
jgi:acetyltransferase-like isoleucine patch superfamily enzyme